MNCDILFIYFCINAMKEFESYKIFQKWPITIVEPTSTKYSGNTIKMETMFLIEESLSSGWEIKWTILLSEGKKSDNNSWNLLLLLIPMETEKSTAGKCMNTASEPMTNNIDPLKASNLWLWIMISSIYRFLWNFKSIHISKFQVFNQRNSNKNAIISLLRNLIQKKKKKS